jgi:hypothetical protein
MNGCKIQRRCHRLNVLKKLVYYDVLLVTILNYKPRSLQQAGQKSSLHPTSRNRLGLNALRLGLAIWLRVDPKTLLKRVAQKCCTRLLLRPNYSASRVQMPY